MLGTWPSSVTKIVELIEGACYTYDKGEANIMKTGIKAGKTAQEVVEEYNPWQKLVQELDATIAQEGSVVQARGGEGDDDPSSSGAKAALADAADASKGPKLVAVTAAGIDLATVEDGWLSYMEKMVQKHLVLVTEKGLSQSQLVKALERHSLATAPAGKDGGGNCIVYFDCNQFGESITAPHIRLPPLQDSIVGKLWKAVKAVRDDPDAPGLLAPGTVFLCLDGGRKRSTVLLNHFGMASERIKQDKGRKIKDGKTVAREIMLHFTESSVQAKKYRKKNKAGLKHVTITSLSLCTLLGKMRVGEARSEHACAGRHPPMLPASLCFPQRAHGGQATAAQAL